MGSYKYASVSYSIGRPGVYLFSTDPETLSSILAELKKFVPTYSIRQKRTLLSGEECLYEIVRLGDKDWEVAMWMVKQLCLQGWEPFASDDGPNNFKLRYKDQVGSEVK